MQSLKFLVVKDDFWIYFQLTECIHNKNEYEFTMTL